MHFLLLPFLFLTPCFFFLSTSLTASFSMVLPALSATDVEMKCCSLSFSKQWRNVISEAYLYCFNMFFF